MVQQFSTGKRLLFLMAGIIITLACNTIVPNLTNTPMIEPSQEAFAAPTISQPTPTIHPIFRPTKARTPIPPHTPVPVFPMDTGTEMADISNACTLVRTEEVAALFPNPPAPISELKKEWGYTISNCIYGNNEMGLTISIASSPDYIDSLAEPILNIKTVSSFMEFSALGAEIYQVGVPKGTPEGNNNVGDTFAAIIMKDNTAVKIVGTGKSYQYHAARETLFVKAVARRLPVETTVFDACNLITIDEAAALFPDPPQPINELNKEEGSSYATCSFRDDNMNLTLAVASNWDSNQELTAQMQNVMKEAPSVIQYSAFGADIYQWGGPNAYTNIGELFSAIIIKVDTVMEINGEGASYQYDEGRETQLVQTIVSRLP